MATAAGESSPLLPTHTSPGESPSRPGLRPSRTVTFSPLTSVSTQSGATSTGNLRPSQSPSAALTSSSQPVRDQPPMLSAFNSKLRRRNSHGAPLPTTQPFNAPRAGAQRTTKTTEKLKILPNPDIDEEDADEESGRDVYSQFTRIKDPTARRDAARLGKADRDRLPRVTAYCMAQGYRLEGIMKFMKSRARTRGANPKLFDECLYGPYDYEYLKKNKSSERGSSPVQERLARVMASPRISPGERRFSDSVVEVEDNNKHRRENLIDLQDELSPSDGASSARPGTLEELSAVTSHSSSDLRHPETDEMHERSNSELSTTVHTPEIFIFDYGTVVIWGMTVQQEQRFLNDMSKFSDAPLPTESVQTENFNFYYTKEYQARIYNDFISLRDPRNHMTKLAISHALSQSVKTSLFEDLVSETIETTSPLPALIAQTGSVNLTRRQLNMQIGELFILRINIHLQGSVLDSPELMWAEPHLEPVYAAVRSYLEIEQRVGLLTERLDVIADLLAVLREQGSRRHGEVLEWIVIILIAAEILVAAVNIVVDLYAGVD
ncbi:sporulation protein rmd1 [Cladophialophora chaetospira]|uniref:Sporulation protein rmd1 n=1 Tax=Cladophialophora chaetospira TaxID=386627 RepID=A0AA38X5H2_9EURO|nr:sporulation protein rmd1 [Cladophialophora chaetospira]